LFAAAIHKNKITGVSSLWTAQQVETDGSGVYIATAASQRIGARYYEIGNLTTTPSLTQSGTLFTAGTSATQNNLRGFIYPTVALSGQGHLSLGASYGSSTEFMGVAVAGKLRTDAPGTIQSPTVAFAGLGSYILCDGTSGACPRNRWGDYSFTDVDPTDDQTVWTFQEYAADATGTGFAGNWATRVVQLKAPPPAAVTAAAPSSVCSNRASTSVVITGTTSAGSEFFDPGSDPGGPGYANHIGATGTGGVTANSVTFTDTTHVTLDLNTTNAPAGTKNITIVNPDGQTATGTNLITVTVCNPGTLQGTITNSVTSGPIVGATVSAGGNVTTTDSNGFYQFANISDGAYTVTASAPGCANNSAAATVTSGQTTTRNLALTPNTSGCFVDTTLTDFQAGVATNLDLTTTPGDIILVKP
jgi:hypothetical protein